MSAKAEGVGEGSGDHGLAGNIGHIIQVTFGVGMFKVNSWWYDAMLDGHYAKGCLSGTSATDKMTGH